MKKKLNIALAAVLIASGFQYTGPAINMNSTVFAENGNDSQDETNVEPIYFNVETDQTIEMGDDRMRSIDVNIENVSPGNAENVSVKAEIENPTNAFIVGNGYIFQNKSINHNSDEDGSFKIETNDNFESATVPIKIIIKFKNEHKSDFETQEETIYVRVKTKDNAKTPAIEITKVENMWPDKIITGQSFPAAFEVKNTGTETADNVKLTLEGLENNNLTLANGLSTADITDLKPGESQNVYFDLKSQNSTPAGSYMLNLKYAFNAKRGEKEGSYSFTIDLEKSESEASNLEFSNITFPTGNVGRNKVVNISFDVKNVGKTVAQNVTVTANSEDQSGLASKSVSKINGQALKPGEKASFSFQFITTPAAETRNYPVTIKVTHTDKNSGPEPYSSEQTVGVFVKAPKESDDNGESSVPKLIIDDYSFEPEIIEAGKPFKMKLRLYNTSSIKSVKNIKIFLTSDVAEKVGDTGVGSSASVFTPVNSSNTFYISNIAPGAKVQKEVELTTVPDTAAKTYTLVANFEYEDSNAEKFTANEQIGVPVIQKAKLNIGEIIPQGEFMIGMDTPLSVDFYNTGKATLYNVMVKISGDGLKFDTPTYYKGNFEPGSTDTFSCNIQPESEGDKKFILNFSYEDSTGEEQSVEKEYDFNVEEMPPMPDDMNNDFEEPSAPFSIKKIIIGIIILAFAITGGIFFKKKRAAKKEDDDNLGL